MATVKANAFAKQCDETKQFVQIDFDSVRGATNWLIGILLCLCSIASTIKRLCRELGQFLIKGRKEGGSGLACVTWYSFPSIETLAGASEETLRKIGMAFLDGRPLTSVNSGRHFVVGAPSFANSKALDIELEW